MPLKLKKMMLRMVLDGDYDSDVDEEEDDEDGDYDSDGDEEEDASEISSSSSQSILLVGEEEIKEKLVEHYSSSQSILLVGEKEEEEIKEKRVEHYSSSQRILLVGEKEEEEIKEKRVEHYSSSQSILLVGEKEEEEIKEKSVEHYSSSQRILLVGDYEVDVSLLENMIVDKIVIMILKKMRMVLDGDEEEDDEDEEEEEDDDDEDEEEDASEIKEKWVEHYSSSQRILLVGEGNYSFSLSLAKAFSSAQNIVATSLDSLKDLRNKYSDGVRNVRKLEEMGGLVLCGLDATCMRDHHFLTTQRFDRIVYNFPHAGSRFPEPNGFQIKMNKELVKGFLKNAKGLLKKEVGEIHVTHKDGYPYDRWNLVKEAQKIGLVLHEKIPFHKHKYPGYYNKRGYGKRSNNPFPLGDCTTYKFKIPH